MKSKSYPYSKSVMLNAVYDALDNLGIDIEQANSKHGIILATLESCPCRILIETVYPEETAKLTLLPLTEDCSAYAECLDAFFDEVSSVLRRSYLKQTR